MKIDIILIWLVIMLGVFFLSLFIQSERANEMCSTQCKELNALGSDVIHKGIGKQDICVCYYPDSIQAFEVE